MKQTTVEWLINQLKDMEYDLRLIPNTIELAKTMEKQQIKDAFGVGCQVESTRLIGYHEMSEQYYNETYGGDK
jgi:hypothetical protein